MAIGPAKRVMFDPNARDADGDSLVQEGTTFERPDKPNVPDLSRAVKPLRKQQSGLPKRRTTPIRETNVSASDVRRGGNLKASKIFKQDLISGLTEEEQIGFLGVDRETYNKMKRPGASLNSFAADRIAVNAFGYHPVQIWGDTWMDEQILFPKRTQIPPKADDDMLDKYMGLRSDGKTDLEISETLGVGADRIAQLRSAAIKRREMELASDEEVNNQNKIAAAREVTNSVFLDTGTSPSGLIGRMTTEIPDDHPMFETMQERDDREQGFADFVYEKYLQPWEFDFWEQNGESPKENDYLDFVAALDADEIRDEFEKETGMSSWGLELDEEGNAMMAEWAEAGFLNEEDYDDWYDGPFSDVFTGTSRDRSNQQGTLFDEDSWTNYRNSKEYTTYGGTDDLMVRNTEQNEKFKKWAGERNWKEFHREHFDWWAFPIDEVSNTYGERFRVPDDELQKLRGDQEFLKRLDENLTNASSAYGWDIKDGRWISDDVRDPDQVPQSLSQIRLYKMARSALVFGRCSHFRSLQRMYDNLSSFGWYKGEDEGFWAKDHQCNQS